MLVSKLAGPWKDMKVLPLALLETILSRPDLKQGYCYGDRPLAALLVTLQNYERANTGRIFRYYYGFLCIRCIMHIVSIGMLRETGTLDTFLVSLDRDLDWKQVCILIADETMRQTVSAIRSEPEPAACARFDAIFQGRKSLPSVGGISAGDCTFVLRLLWEDRTSFLTLCERGLLPGCPTLLYTLCRIVLAQPMASADLQPRLIQELCVRPYLSSSNTEKYALRDVCRIASQRAPTMKPIDLGEAVLEDNRVLAGAYIRMVSSRDPNNACFQTADWDGMATLLTHVLFAVRRDSATKRECLVIVEKTISFVWLILANKTHQPDYVCSLSDSHNIWPYFLAIFGSLCMLQDDSVGSHEAELEFA